MLSAHNILKFSALLILSNYVFLSEQYQPCLAIAKAKDAKDYTFALAQVDDYHNPLGAQEACYYSCGAEIVTQSSNRGDMSRLTLMDNAATFLTASGFLKVGESYFLNHLGLGDNEGGNGIGCIEVKPGNKINHYPKSHAVCKIAKAAVCGFWGQQSIPPQPKEVKPKPPPVPKPSSKTTTLSKKPKSTRTPKPKPKPSKVVASVSSSIKLVVPTSFSLPIEAPIKPSRTANVVSSSSQNVGISVVTEGVSISKIQSALPSSASTTVTNGGPENVKEKSENSVSGLGTEVIDSTKFVINGKAFHVTSKYENSVASAFDACTRKQAEIASVTSEDLTAVSEKLREFSQGKVIIGAWNGDGYSLSGDQCLILHSSNGIYPGTCSEASAILCQSIQ